MKFSVLLPTRNRLEYLRYAVETIRRQDYPDWEIVISDNFSEEDIAGYVQSLDEPRVVYRRTPGFVAVTDNWNTALEASSGDYVIMLGDDDALMQGCLSRLARWIEEYSQPDLVYIGGLVYAYPNVVPEAPGGYVQVHSYGKCIRGKDAPFWMEDAEARALVDATMNFKVAIDYNMQFSVISRATVEAMSKSGPFFRSPFPDYYATNVLLLRTKRRLVVPTPLVAVGISPKSYGFFHANQQEKSGMNFLNSLPTEGAQDRELLPGTNINSSWLLSLDAIRAECGAQYPELKPNERRYRWLQIVYVYLQVFATAGMPPQMLDELHHKLHGFERWLAAGVLAPVLRLLRLVSPRIVRGVLGRWNRRFDQFEAGRFWPAQTFQGRFKNILEVYEQLDPGSLLDKKASELNAR